MPLFLHHLRRTFEFLQKMYLALWEKSHHNSIIWPKAKVPGSIPSRLPFVTYRCMWRVACQSPLPHGQHLKGKSWTQILFLSQVDITRLLQQKASFDERPLRSHSSQVVKYLGNTSHRGITSKIQREISRESIETSDLLESWSNVKHHHDLSFYPL